MMRRALFILLIVLLPLRLWAGERMALPITVENRAASEVVMAQADAVAHVPSMGADCPMSYSRSASSEQGDASCQWCDLCMPLAALKAARIEFAKLLAAPEPLRPALAFANTDPRRILKPPIART